MRVLVACETSGEVRRAFGKLGHDAWSCDLLPADDGNLFHIQGDAIEAIKAGCPPHGGRWDLVIAHPPCTYLTVSGNRWYADSPERDEGVAFVAHMMETLDACTDAWALENPVGVISSRIRKPDQYIQPWQFGHGETKKTGLWLHNLPTLVPTHIVEGREQRVWKMGPSPDRWKLRSKTYEGIARAMAAQWGGIVMEEN